MNSCRDGIIPPVFPIQMSVRNLFFLFFATAVFFCGGSYCQTASARSDAPSGGDIINMPAFSGSRSADPPFQKENETSAEDIMEKRVFINFLQDQKAIWTSPLRLKPRDGFWLVPAAAIVGEMIHRDAYVYQRLTPAIHPGTFSKTFSDYGVAGMAGGVAGLYLLGRVSHNDHMRETAVLATEAAVDSLTVSTALKITLRRDRPETNNGRGDFLSSGFDASFPSDHSIAAWSIATVVAHEYPGVLTKVSAYALATAVSVARVTGRQHFPADVLVGGALGWGIGQYVYKKHHDSELPGESVVGHSHEVSAKNMGSVDEPMDSWVYPEFDRLAAAGLLDSAFAGTRPWTRLECARLVNEATTKAESDYDGNSLSRDIPALRAYFGKELSLLEGDSTNGSAQVDSVYTRVTGISGEPLRDGFHFGETINNDYGRPYAEGVNAIAGVSSSASYGHWVAYVRGEYQHSLASPPLSLNTLQDLAIADSLPAAKAGQLPVAAGPKFTQVDRLRFLDAYAGYTFDGWELSAGKQTLWWGSGQSSAFIMSSNAEPVPMVRLARVTPAELPAFFQFLGPMRFEAFLGQLSGQLYVRTHPDVNTAVLFGPGLRRQPFLEGARVTFKPTRNFEFGVSVTTVFGSDGFPITARTFLRSLGLSNTDPGFFNDPGDRRSGFDFKYRIPGLRNWLTLYNDSFTEDEISPIGYPRRSAMNPGLYLARVPKLDHLDLRAEGIYTDIPNLRQTGSYYANARFLSGYTNQGNILGSWIGRDDTGFRLESNYWFSGENKLRLQYRDVRINPAFMPGGGHTSAWSTELQCKLNSRLQLQAGFQWERWIIPALTPGEKRDVASTIQLTFNTGKRR